MKDIVRVKRLLIKSWPYLTSLISGIVLFFIAVFLKEDYKGLLINIAATLLAIPLLFLIYELAKAFSSRKLNKELFDYAKMQIDRETLSVVMHLIKIVHPYIKQDKSQHGVQTFLSQSEEDLQTIFNTESFLGFQVLRRCKHFGDVVTYIAKHLTSPSEVGKVATCHAALA